MTMPRVLIGPYLLRGQPGGFRQILTDAGFDVVDPHGDFSLTRDQLLPHLGDIDALIAGGERMSADLFPLAPKLRISYNNQVIHAGGWDRALVRPVRGMTLGLVGMGRIGRAVALRAPGFQVSVVAFDTLIDADFDQRHGIKRVSLDDLLACSDVVSLHVPLTDTTRGMVNREFLAKMKPGSYLINTARGGLIVESDLRDAVVSGHLAGAGLDVMQKEPPDPDCPLLGVPNIILCPHIAGTDLQSMSDMAELAARTIVELSQSRWPANCVVNSVLRATWKW
jgi:D-3-phosphoglycerate dehydrogenase / 2-oxoglutarate reductase